MGDHLKAVVATIRKQQLDGLVLGMGKPEKKISKKGKTALFKIIEKYITVFTDEEVKVGKTDWVEMDIRIKPDARPVCAKVRPLSKAQKDNLKVQLDSWLKDGVITES